MKIALVYPERFAKWDWIAAAARQLGYEVRVFRPDQAHHRNQRKISSDYLHDADRWADLVLFSHRAACCNKTDLVAASDGHRSVWAHWWFDLIENDSGVEFVDQLNIREFGDVMRAMDVVFVKERARIEDYSELGINAVWMHQACPSSMPEVSHIDEPRWHAFLFGRFDSRQRRRDVDALVDAGMRVGWSGRGGTAGISRGIETFPFTEPLDLPALVSPAACVLSVDHRHDVRGYWSDRLELASGMGACVVRRQSPGLPKYVRHVYGTGLGLVRLVARLHDDLDARCKSAVKARTAVMDGHTYEHRVREVISVALGEGKEGAQARHAALSSV